MSEPLVIAHHVMWTAYGWWLPNDPRGSTSTSVCAPDINELGEHHFGRKRVQPASRDIRAFYVRAAEVLDHDLLAFAPAEFAAVAEAFAATCARHAYTCYACAVMPDHAHLIIRKHRHSAEEMIANLQDESRVALVAAGLRPPGHPVWTGGGGWKVFLDHPDDVRRTIRYVEQNPVKMRLPTQAWPFVQAYDDWPLFPGHSANSPYARALRAAGRYHLQGRPLLSR